MPVIISNDRFKKKKTLDIFRYTQDMFFNIYGDENHINESIFSWVANNDPDDVYHLIIQRLLELRHLDIPGWYVPRDIEKARIVTLGEEYGDYLMEHDMADTPENRRGYADSLSDEDCARLMQEYGMDRTCDVFYLPLICLFNYNSDKTYTKTHCKLNERAKKSITEYMQKVFNTAEVFVPGYILGMHEVNVHSDYLYTMMHEYFDNGVKIRYGLLEQQEEIDCEPGYFPFFIPIYISKKLTSATIHIDEIEKHLGDSGEAAINPENVVFVRELLSRYDCGDMPGINDTSIPEDIQRCMPRGITAATFVKIVRPASAPNFLDDVNVSFTSEGEEE